MIDRRTFLRQLAAAPAVFGLKDLWGQDSSNPAPPTWWTDALKRMKETHRYGVVLVSPSDARGRIALGDALLARLEAEDTEVLECFCEAVYIVLRPDLAARLLREKRASAGENRYLFDPEGKQLPGDSVSLEILKDSKRFAESFSLFVRGPKNEQLRKTAERIASESPAEVRAAIEKLNADDMDAREAAVATLVRHADAVAPLLVYARLTDPSEERRLRLGMVLRRYFHARPLDQAGSRLPYGTVRQVYRGGCGGIEAEEEGRSIECGRARVTEEGRKFLRFLTK